MYGHPHSNSRAGSCEHLCLVARAKKRDRDRKYNLTAKGMLRQIRYNASRRGSR